MELIGGTDSAESIADQAMKRCQPEQAKTLAAAVKAYGPSAAALVDRLAVVARSQVVEIVNQRRSGAPVNDPGVAWGQCLGKSARTGAEGRADAGAVLDQIFASCRDTERRARATLEAQVGHEQAEALMSQIQGQLRDQINKLIAQIRQAR